jgi:spore maturation protein CgeB
MRIAFFGCPLAFSDRNGATAYFRGVLRALAGRGHAITVFTPHERRARRDLADRGWAKLVAYAPDERRKAIRRARHADVVVNASRPGETDLDEIVLEVDGGLKVFWDVDAAATPRAMTEYVQALLPSYDLVLVRGGGERVRDAYCGAGARDCLPVYDAFDREEHRPVRPLARYDADLTLVADRQPDLEPQVAEFLFSPARRLPEHDFLLAGAGWDDVPGNVTCIHHVPAEDRDAVLCSALAVLAVTSAEAAAVGWSPPSSVLDAAGVGACVITNAWEGVEEFLEPGVEVLVAREGAEVAQHLLELTPMRARAIGAAAREHILESHTYDERAAEVERVLDRVHA